MPPPRPVDLNGTSLTAAKGTQLDFWIDAANKAADDAGKKKVLAKTGRVDERRQRLADYYNIDLSSLPAPEPIGPATVDRAINKMQWAHLLTLGNEWKQKEEAGIPFRLVNDDPAAASTQRLFLHIYLLRVIDAISANRLHSAIDEVLTTSFEAFGLASSSEQMTPTIMDTETVQALIESAKDGDVGSIAALLKFKTSLMVCRSIIFLLNFTKLAHSE